MCDRDQAVSAFFVSQASEFHDTGWIPRVDIYSGSGGWLIKCDLAGIRTEEVTVSLQGSTLSIRGVRRDQLSEDGWNHYSMEIPIAGLSAPLRFPTAEKPLR